VRHAHCRCRQQLLLEKIRGHGMRMIGPNCLGLLNTDPRIRLNASFAPDFPPVGQRGFQLAKGALGLAVIALARERGLRLASFVSAARVLGRLALYAEWRDQPEGIILDFDDIRPQEARAICENTRREHGAAWLSGEETRKVLAAFALPVSPGGICATAEEAAKLAAQVGFPVALKLASRTIVHKTEFGGVRFNRVDEAAVRQAFLEIQQRVAQDNKLAKMEGVLIQPMISDGVELMVGWI
jgi:acyl-CoA synthetase (NDP forming)